MKVEIYDTTLRDGAQTQGISFSVHDKVRIAKKLDDLDKSEIFDLAHTIALANIDDRLVDAINRIAELSSEEEQCQD